MQSQRDAKRIMELGAESSRVVVTGNMKFDDLPKSA
jgi:3-deoxy-D-manno-octulosonic-acid transferase